MAVSGAFGVLVLCGLVQVGYYAPLLPDVVASHFGYQGMANGWMSKTLFIIVHLAMLVLIVLMRMFSINFRLPQSKQFISLPQKDYWLADERREQTEAYIGQQFVQLSTNALVFILVLMMVFMLYILIWVVKFYRHFGRRSQR